MPNDEGIKIKKLFVETEESIEEAVRNSAHSGSPRNITADDILDITMLYLEIMAQKCGRELFAMGTEQFYIYFCICWSQWTEPIDETTMTEAHKVVLEAARAGQVEGWIMGKTCWPKLTGNMISISRIALYFSDTRGVALRACDNLYEFLTCDRCSRKLG